MSGENSAINDLKDQYLKFAVMPAAFILVASVYFEIQRYYIISTLLVPLSSVTFSLAVLLLIIHYNKTNKLIKRRATTIAIVMVSLLVAEILYIVLIFSFLEVNT